MKLTKTKICGSLAVAATIAVFSGCGDESTTNNIDNTAVLAFDADSLPECAKANEGELAFNKTDNTLRVCYDAEWFVLNGKPGQKGNPGDPGEQGDPGKPGAQGQVGDDGTGCTVTTLKDSTGLKLVCDGDSIGVIKHGKQGDPGNPGENGADCIPCTTEQLADNSGYKIVCGGDSVAVVLNGKSMNNVSPLSSSSKNVIPVSSSAEVPLVESSSAVAPLVESSSNEEPAFEDKSSSSALPPIAGESSSSHFSTTYDKTKLPLNFNELLTFFTVDNYTQSYVESGDYYNHTWSLSATTDDDNTDAVIKIINSAAKGSGVLETEYSLQPALGLNFYQHTSNDGLFSIEIISTEDLHSYSHKIELTHHEYISEPVTPVTESSSSALPPIAESSSSEEEPVEPIAESSSSEFNMGNCPEGTSSPSGYSATVFPDGLDLLGKSPKENISITEATYSSDCDMDFGNSNFINTWSFVYKPTGTTTQDYDELSELRLALDSQAANNGFKYSSASNYNGVRLYYYTKDDGSSVTMKLNETTVDLTVELIYIEQLSGEPSQPAPTQSE